MTEIGTVLLGPPGSYQIGKIPQKHLAGLLAGTPKNFRKNSAHHFPGVISQEPIYNIDMQNQLTPTDPGISYRHALLKQANMRIPLSQEGLPVGLYRVDLLPHTPPDTNVEAATLEALRNAYVDLNYDQGYPTLGDGRPYWHKLDFEPSLAYGCFQKYLDALNDGPRQLATLATDEELLQVAHQGGLITNVDAKEELLLLLTEFSTLYTWSYRARAFDLFREAAYRHKRLRRQMNVEDEHFTKSSAMLKKLEETVLATDDFWDGLKKSPRLAIEFMGKLYATQRISTGLPGGGPLATKEQTDETSFEMIMRSVANKQGNVYDQSGVPQASRDAVEKILNDQQTTEQMQEVVIRVTKASHQTSKDMSNPFGAQSGEGARQFKTRKRTTEAIPAEDLLMEPNDLAGAPGVDLSDRSSEGPDAG